MKFEVQFSSGKTHNVELPNLVPGIPVEVDIDGETVGVTLVHEGTENIVLEVDGKRFDFCLRTSNPDSGGQTTILTLLHANRPYRMTVCNELDRIRANARGSSQKKSSQPVTVYSQLPGVVRQVFVEAGNSVPEGKPVLTLEAMKMENEIQAEISGRLETVFVETGQVVTTHEPLFRIVPE